jgi:hypothetical protein
METGIERNVYADDSVIRHHASPPFGHRLAGAEGPFPRRPKGPEIRYPCSFIQTDT